VYLWSLAEAFDDCFNDFNGCVMIGFGVKGADFYGYRPFRGVQIVDFPDELQRLIEGLF
jgi:hypothetical protein